MQKFLILSSMGIEIGVMIYVAYLVGGWLDEKYQTKGLIFAGLAFIFLIAWLTQIVFLLRRLEKLEEKQESGTSSEPKSF